MSFLFRVGFRDGSGLDVGPKPHRSPNSIRSGKDPRKAAIWVNVLPHVVRATQYIYIYIYMGLGWLLLFAGFQGVAHVHEFRGPEMTRLFRLKLLP